MTIVLRTAKHKVCFTKEDKIKKEILATLKWLDINKA